MCVVCVRTCTGPYRGYVCMCQCRSPQRVAVPWLPGARVASGVSCVLEVLDTELWSSARAVLSDCF